MIEQSTPQGTTTYAAQPDLYPSMDLFGDRGVGDMLHSFLQNDTQYSELLIAFDRDFGHSPSLFTDETELSNASQSGLMGSGPLL